MGSWCDVRGVFLDISEAFDKFWNRGVILKLNQNGISGNLRKIMEDFLSNRNQRVVLNIQFSGWAAVNAGLPQGSIFALFSLHPLLIKWFIIKP